MREHDEIEMSEVDPKTLHAHFKGCGLVPDLEEDTLTYKLQQRGVAPIGSNSAY